MAAPVDLKGQKFGCWDVVEYFGRHNCRSSWLCRCVCGTQKPVRGDRLRRGESKSCGCMTSTLIGTAAAAKATKWTPERNEILRQGWPTHRPTVDICEDLNATPGPRIKPHELATRAYVLGIARPKDFDISRKKKPGPNAWLFAKPRRAVSAPRETDIAAWIAKHGVTKCPPAACAHTTATIADADKQALEAYRQRKERDWAAEHAQRAKPSIASRQNAWLRSAGAA